MSVITTTDALAALCERLSGADYLTVDTEFMRETTFWPKLCLVQIAGPDEAAAIDPLADGIDLSPLFGLLNDPGILKVMHAGRQDLEIFYHLTGEVPVPLFDTQVAAMVCGFGDQVGYEALIAKLAKVQLDKSSRFTDWSHRPLSDRQLEYALGDVVHLRPAYEKLRARVEEQGRMGWIEEEITALCDPGLYRIVPEETWRRLKPKRGEARYLSVLQAIAAWREEEAMTRDQPRNRVVRDEVLLQLAAHPPADAGALARVRGLSRGFEKSRMGEGLLAAIQSGLERPAGDAPALPRRPDLPRGIGPVTDLLKVLLKFKCDAHNVAQRLVASVADLEQIAADENADVAALKGWRRELFGEDALRLRNGQVALTAAGRRMQLVPVSEAGEAEAPTPPASNGGEGNPGKPRRRRGRRRKKAPAETADV